MLRLKKKKAEEAAAAASAPPSAAATDTESVDSMDVEPTGDGKLSLIGGIGGKKVGSKDGGRKKRTPGEIRIQKDIAELDSGTVASISFPSASDLTNFVCEVTPDSGYWSGVKYTFTFTIPALYPHEPPKVHCETALYHPNVNTEGNVCLNILREDWKPVLDINAVIYGLIYLFYEPNPNDPLNHAAAKLLRENKREFERNVEKSIRGGYVDGVNYSRLKSTGWHARVVQSSTIVCTKHLYLKVDSGLAMAPSNRVAVGCLLALLRLCLAACVVIEIPLATRDSLFIKSLVVEESPEGSLQVNLEGVVHNVEAGEARGALESPLVRTIDANIEAAAGEFCSLHLGHLGDKGEDCARTVGVIARRELEARRSNGETDEGLVWNVVSYVKKGSHATSLLDRIERLTSGLTGEVHNIALVYLSPAHLSLLYSPRCPAHVRYHVYDPVCSDGVAIQRLQGLHPSISFHCGDLLLLLGQEVSKPTTVYEVASFEFPVKQEYADVYTTVLRVAQLVKDGGEVGLMECGLLHLRLAWRHVLGQKYVIGGEEEGGGCWGKSNHGALLSRDDWEED